jgi:DeoR family transcriptional regulator of aga operon
MTVIERAQKIVVPVDHTKIGAVDLTKVCGLDQIDFMVTDQADPMLEKVCGDQGIRLIIAGLSRKRDHGGYGL